jgi:DNA-binding NtrC family response regulator
MKALKMLRSEFPEVLIILLTGWGTINLAVEDEIRAKDFLTKPWKNDHLLQSIRTILDLEEKTERVSTRKKLDQKFDFEHIVGEDPKLLSILETIGRVAPTDAPVLITGESGTGKELIAEAIHQNSKRRIRPFVKVNLGEFLRPYSKANYLVMFVAHLPMPNQIELDVLN